MPVSERQAARPRIAVALAAFNGAAWLDAQMDSILGQREVEVLVFVSIDPSSDGTEALLAARARQEPRLAILPPAGPFGGAAANFFRLVRDIDLTGFDGLALADQDDIWFPDKLARACAVLASGRAAGYSSNVLAFWPDGRERLIDKAQPQREWDYLFEAAGPGCTYVFGPVLARALQSLVRERWQAVQGIGLHDWLFYAYARAHGHLWHIDPWPGLRYRQHGANQVGVNRGWPAFRSRLAKIRSGWAREQCRQVALLAGVDPQSPVVRALSAGWPGSLYLACNAGKTRRSLTGRLALAALCLVNLF